MDSDGPRVGVVHGPKIDDPGDAIGEAIRAADCQPREIDPAEASEGDLDVAVAVGEPAVLALARSRPAFPVLPVDAGIGLRSIDRDDLTAALDRYGDANWRRESHPLLDVDVGGQPYGPALVDVLLVTAEPAHISEFALSRPDESIARVRADGIVVATPAGTTGYAGRAGAAIVPPESGVLAVEPIAPFARSPNDWIVPATDLSLAVERDEVEVELQLDDRTVATVGADETVRLTAAGAMETVVVPESASPFARRGARLEKL